MSERLVRALDDSRAELEAGLAEAERELAALQKREAELRVLIGRAKAALGISSEAVHPPTRMTLHEAIALVLREHDNRWMTVREIAEEVNRRRLYEKRDKSRVEPNQIHARTKNYPSLFEKDRSNVRLIQSGEK